MATKKPMKTDDAAKKTAAKPAAKSRGKAKAGARSVTANVRARKPRVAFSPEVWAKILSRIAGGEPLTKVCSTPSMPARKCIFEWIAADTTLLAQYEAALQMRADAYFDETVQIADEVPPKEGESGKMDSAWVSWQKNRVDARKWAAARLAPKKYGDRLDLNHSGKIELTDEQVQTRLALLLAKAKPAKVDE